MCRRSCAGGAGADPWHTQDPDCTDWSKGTTRAHAHTRVQRHAPRPRGVRRAERRPPLPGTKRTCSVRRPVERRHATCSAASGRSNTVTLRPGCARASSGARAPRQPAGGRDALCGLALWGLRKPRGESFSLSTTKRCSRMGGGPCYETQPAVGAMAGVSRRPWGPPRPAERGAECWGRGRRPGKGGSSERSCEGRTLPSSLLRGADAMAGVTAATPGHQSGCGEDGNVQAGGSDVLSGP